MTITRLLVISDLHIAAPGPLNSFHQGPALSSFVRAHASPGTTLVIAGDGFDLLQTDPRPTTLDMSRAPDLIERTLAAIGAEPWGQELFAALATFLDSGTHLVLLPGNHDPELHDPATKPLLLRAVGRAHDHPGLEIHTADAPYRAQLGRWEAIVGHGHRSDPFNDIDPAKIRRAVATADPSLSLPPGSRLVIHAINRFKRARDPLTGAPRFAFIDLLKPEKPSVPYLLLYLDLPLALAGLAEAFGPIAHAVLRGARRRLQGGPTLALNSDGDDDAPDPLEAIGEGLVDGFDAAERRSPDGCVLKLEEMLEGTEAPAEGMLASPGGYRLVLLRAFLRKASHDGTFFNPAIASKDEDLPIIKEHLAGAQGPRVVIAGHTHAAREIRDGERVYLNTGTWSDLMRLPRLVDLATMKRFAEDLEANQVKRIQRPTYAEVTADGPQLRQWTGSGGVPVESIVDD
jgi:UDP-2,3-diacylglucosamine pyrophosphatase LpxH